MRKKKLNKTQEQEKRDKEDRKKEQEVMDLFLAKNAKKAAKRARKEAEREDSDTDAESTGKMFAKHLRLVNNSSLDQWYIFL